MLDTNLILIGPSGSGKTTLAKLLGEALGVPSIDLDNIRWDYYAEIGYDREHAEQIRKAQGMSALIHYWKPFEIYSVERMFQDYPSGHVIAFGAGQSVYDDPALFERARKALAPYTVILLLPSPDVDESISLLNERIRLREPDLPDELFPVFGEMNRSFIEHPSNARLATHIVYTKGKTSAETRDEILALVNRS
ncbi:MAG: AAA family ATPase [Chloroflexota bacterium]